MVTIILQREFAADVSDKAVIGTVLSALNKDEAVRKLKRLSQLRIVITKRALVEP